MNTSQWTKTSFCKPNKDSKVIWIDPNGKEQPGKFCGGQVWYPEGSTVYIYYTPEYWKYA